MYGISVVVCTHNRLELLKKCVASLLAQSYDQYEIIFVDDNSIDGTKEFLDNLSSPRIKIIHHEQTLGLCPSRNDGIAKAYFDIITFTDDDCVADKNWLSEIAKNSENNFDFGAGLTYYVSPNYKGYFPERVVNNPAASWPKGNNLFFSRKVFDKIGLFDKFFDSYNNDDSEIAIRAKSFGFQFRSIPSAIIYHQKTYWKAKNLFFSALNPSVWVVLKKKYLDHYRDFKPPVFANILIHPEDYLQIILMPVLLPVLLIRYLYHGQTNLKLFFVKWPLYPFARRYFIYREAIRQRTFML